MSEQAPERVWLGNSRSPIGPIVSNVVYFDEPQAAASTEYVLASQLHAKEAEIERLREALSAGEALIAGDLVGLDWKRGCQGFLKMARAALGGKE